MKKWSCLHAGWHLQHVFLWGRVCYRRQGRLYTTMGCGFQTHHQDRPAGGWTGIQRYNTSWISAVQVFFCSSPHTNATTCALILLHNSAQRSSTGFIVHEFHFLNHHLYSIKTPFFLSLSSLCLIPIGCWVGTESEPYWVWETLISPNEIYISVH